MVSLSEIINLVSILSIVTLKLMLYIINTAECISLPLQNKIEINRKLIISLRFHAETIANLNTNVTAIPHGNTRNMKWNPERQQNR